MGRSGLSSLGCMSPVTQNANASANANANTKTNANRIRKVNRLYSLGQTQRVEARRRRWQLVGIACDSLQRESAQASMEPEDQGACVSTTNERSLLIDKPQRC
jgi:hypothetical protein